MIKKTMKICGSLSALTILSLVLFITPALATGEMSGTRSISDTNIEAGDTVTVTVSMNIYSRVGGPAIEESLPDGWNLTVKNDGGMIFFPRYNSFSYSGYLFYGDSRTVVYDLTVPQGTDDGVYDITGVLTAYSVNPILIRGDTQVTVGEGFPAVTADFSANNTSGYVPLAVKFTDLSTGATSWQWDFDGDGATDSTDQNPIYTYTSEGTYTVKLTASGNGDGDSETKAGYVTVSSKPFLEANFTSNTTSGKAPLSVKFTDLSSGEATSWKWDFDGDSIIDSTEQNPIYTYTENGTYTVKLTVSNCNSNSSLTEVNYVTVSDGDYVYNSYEATAVSLSATIIPAMSIEVTPGVIDFGILSAGEISDDRTVHIKNKGSKDARITAQVTDVAKGLYEDGLMIDSESWNSYSKYVESCTTQSSEASLHVPSDFIGIGSMEGKLVFWAEMR